MFAGKLVYSIHTSNVTFRYGDNLDGLYSRITVSRVVAAPSIGSPRLSPYLTTHMRGRAPYPPRRGR